MSDPKRRKLDVSVMDLMEADTDPPNEVPIPYGVAEVLRNVRIPINAEVVQRLGLLNRAGNPAGNIFLPEVEANMDLTGIEKVDAVRMDVDGISIGEAIEILEGGHLPSLKELKIETDNENIPIMQRCLRALAPRSGKMTSLEFDDDGMTAEGYEGLYRAVVEAGPFNWDVLESLSASEAMLTVLGMELAESGIPTFPALKYLHIVVNPVGTFVPSGSVLRQVAQFAPKLVHLHITVQVGTLYAVTPAVGTYGKLFDLSDCRLPRTIRSFALITTTNDVYVTDHAHWRGEPDKFGKHGDLVVTSLASLEASGIAEFLQVLTLDLPLARAVASLPPLAPAKWPALTKLRIRNHPAYLRLLDGSPAKRLTTLCFLFHTTAWRAGKRQLFGFIETAHALCDSVFVWLVDLGNEEYNADVDALQGMVCAPDTRWPDLTNQNRLLQLIEREWSARFKRDVIVTGYWERPYFPMDTFL